MKSRPCDENPGVASIDRALGRAVVGLALKPHPWVALAATLVSERARDGSVCVELGALAGGSENAVAFGIDAWPALAPWQAVLDESGVVSDGSAPAPLVLRPGGRLYFYRHWLAERNVAGRVMERASGAAMSIPPAGLEGWLSELFPSSSGETDWQRVAAVTALLGRLTLIVGGPGTGKTSVVVRLLALLALTAAHSSSPAPRVLLLAPTGKAAQRLVESIQRAKSRLPLSAELLASIPETASTLHRALYAGRRIDALGRYELPEALAADVVVVDEASMAALALLSALFDAVPTGARLVILGDDQQLASVEAGSVLGDLTSSARGRGYGAERCDVLERLGCGRLPRSVLAPPQSEAQQDQPQQDQPQQDQPQQDQPQQDQPQQDQPLRDQIVELEKSYRFDAQSGIGALVRALRRGVAAEVLRIIEGRDHPDIEWIEVDVAEGLDARFDHAVREGYSAYVRTTSPKAALGALGRFRVLAAHRRGRLGVEGLTARAERALEGVGLGVSSRDYPKRPLLVTENSYRLELFNGDIGVLWKGEGGVTRAHFVSGSGMERALAVPRLPAHDTAFVMSIHKSQGSEFDEIVCVLPGEGSPLLTRELLYTAVSRAKKRVLLFASRASIEVAVGRTVRRSSGLGALVWERGG